MKKVVALLARGHGLNALETLLKSKKYQVVAIATHRLKPMAEDPTRSPRIEFPIYKHLAAKARVPLFTVDRQSEQEQLESALQEIPFDLIASVSWRRLIPSSLIAKATHGGVNLHRGRLPDYPGAEPIKQALLKSERTIVISAHRLTEVIDGGEVLCYAEHPIRAELSSLSLDQQVSVLKQEITPLFGPLLIRALDLASRSELAGQRVSR